MRRAGCSQRSRKTAHCLLAIGLLLLRLLAPADAAAQTESSAVRFCFGIWPPYTQADESGYFGISFEVMTEAARRADLTAQFHELPWNRCLEMVRQGRMDAVMDAAEREEFLQGPASYNVYTNTVWLRDNSALTALSFGDLAGQRIGLVHGYEYPDALFQEFADNAVDLAYSVDEAANIRMLRFGRVDAIVADLVSTLSFVRDNNLAIRPLVPNHSLDRLYPSFNSNRVEQQRAIDAALTSMIADGSIDEIYRAYLEIGFEDTFGQ